MGTEKKKQIRAVLDTNVLVSALLFGGELARVVSLWQAGAFVPVISKETFEEFKAVLDYPKFCLEKFEADTIIQEEILPFFEVTEVKEQIHGICSDSDDDIFLSCALSAAADYIVTGDKGLCSLKNYKQIKIIPPADFIRLLGSLK